MIIIILAIPALYFFCLLFISFINKPLIEDINVPDMTNFEFQINQNDIRDNNNQIESPLTFDYQLIGYRSGETDFFCYFKKRQQRVVVSSGDKLEGLYELVAVNEDEVIFHNKRKLYKIKNSVGK